MADPQAYLTKQKTAQRYSVSSRTVERWERDYAIGFPAALVVNGRRLYNVAALESWERARAAGQPEAA